MLSSPVSPRRGLPFVRHFAIACLLLLVWQLGNAAPNATTDATRPKRVLIISVDGLRPDLALRGDCPNLRDLIARGSFTLWAQTTPGGKTLPSHTSMLTGRTVPLHGIHWNSAQKPTGVEYTYAKVPT